LLFFQNYRYSVGLGGFSGNKNSKAIQINERLDLSNYQFDHYKFKTDARPLRYHLVSMVIHYGSSLNSGHYTAIGLTPSGSYYYFNDSNVIKYITIFLYQLLLLLFFYLDFIYRFTKLILKIIQRVMTPI